MAVTIIVGSTALFLIWLLFFHSRATPRAAALHNDAASHERAAKAEARIDYLFLADDDLYDAGTGECLFKNWLHGDHPVRLFYDQGMKKIIGEYPAGFARYGFDGMREAAMMMPRNLPAFIPGGKKVVFAKRKDVWIADIDWQKFAFTNQRQVTTMGVFYEQNFAENVQLLTSKTLVMRNVNNLLRVNLESGDVHPMRIPLGEIGRRRSPDSRLVVGQQGSEFYCYDVDANNAKTVPFQGGKIIDFCWLGNDRCLGLAASKEIIAYDRLADELTDVCPLPFPCYKMVESSPDGRFIFTAGGMNMKNGVLVDLEKKTAEPIKGGAGITWVSNDTFVFSRDVPDSDWRGTWQQTAGQPEKRILPEPCVAGRGNPAIIALPSINILLLVTRSGVAKSNYLAAGPLQKMITRLPNRLSRIETNIISQ